MKKVLIIGGIVAGVAVIGIAGFVVAKKVKGGGGFLGGNGATPDSAMGFIPGVEVGFDTRSKYIDYLSHWAMQQPSALQGIQSINMRDPAWLACRNCLTYGKGQPDYPGPGKKSPTALWWRDIGNQTPTDCEPPKCQPMSPWIPKIKSKIGCNPMLGGIGPSIPEYGRYDCMGKFMRAAEDYKNSCEACKNIPLMPFMAV